MQLLRSQGVDYAQGFHIGRPAPLAEILPARQLSANASAAAAVKSIAGSTVCQERTSSTKRLPWPVNAS